MTTLKEAQEKGKKYNPDNFSDEEIEMVEKIRDKFVEIRQQYYD